MRGITRKSFSSRIFMTTLGLQFPALVSRRIVHFRSVGNSASISASIRSSSARSTFGGGTGHEAFFDRRFSSKTASFSNSDAGSVSMAASISASVLMKWNASSHVAASQAARRVESRFVTEDVFAIHPANAARNAIADGDTVRVFSARGEVKQRTCHPATGILRSNTRVSAPAFVRKVFRGLLEEVRFEGRGKAELSDAVQFLHQLREADESTNVREGLFA